MRRRRDGWVPSFTTRKSTGAAAFPPGSWAPRGRVRGSWMPRSTRRDRWPGAPAARRTCPRSTWGGRSPRPPRARRGTCSSSSARTSRGSAPRARAAAWTAPYTAYNTGNRRTSTTTSSDEHDRPQDVQTRPEPVAADEVPDRVDRAGHGILEATTQRGVVLQRQRLPEVAELRAHPREATPALPRPVPPAVTRADSARPDASRQPRTPSTAIGITSSTPTGRHSPARKPRGRGPQEPVRPDPEEHEDAEHHRGRLGVAEHETNAAGKSAPNHAAGAPARRRRSAEREAVRARRTATRTRWRSRSARASGVVQRDPSADACEHRDQGEEPERAVPDRSVAVFGNGAVVRSVPREQTLPECDRTGAAPISSNRWRDNASDATTSTRARIHGTTATRRSRRTNSSPGSAGAQEASTPTRRLERLPTSCWTIRPSTSWMTVFRAGVSTCTAPSRTR